MPGLGPLICLKTDHAKIYLRSMKFLIIISETIAHNTLNVSWSPTLNSLLSYKSSSKFQSYTWEVLLVSRAVSWMHSMLDLINQDGRDGFFSFLQLKLKSICIYLYILHIQFI